MSSVFKVTYFDPCNGMNSSSVSKGLFDTRESAESYINEKIGMPGSAKRLNPNNLDAVTNAYRIKELEMSE